MVASSFLTLYKRAHFSYEYGGKASCAALLSPSSFTLIFQSEELVRLRHLSTQCSPVSRRSLKDGILID